MTEEMNEKLREACCMGDKECVYKCLSQGADINSKNKMNGWTSLHWAAKRGHTSLIEILLRSHADPDVLNDKQQTAYDVADIDDVRDVLLRHRTNSSDHGSSAFHPIPAAANHDQKQRSFETGGSSKINFVPNYLQNPVFPYGGSSSTTNNNNNKSQQFEIDQTHSFENLKAQANKNSSIVEPSERNAQDVAEHYVESDNELVLKIRFPDSGETDFIEVEIKFDELTFDNLVKISKREFGIDRITKIRKLPDTIVRKDKDVRRFKQFQELEIIH